MSWLEAVPAITVAALLLFVPGLPVAWAAGARGLALVALSAPASFGVVAVASVVAGFANVPWSLLPVGVTSALLALVALGLRRTVARGVPRPAVAGPPMTWAAIIGGSVGGGILLVALAAGIGAPDHPNQLYDAVFHLNAARFVIETGSASPLEMTLATPDRATGFYPTLWHAFAALIAVLSSQSVVVATNALTIAVIVLVWPIAIMYLAHVLRPASRSAVAYAGALSAGFAMFPFGLLSWGVLYPNLLGTVAVPILIALAATLLGLVEPTSRIPALLGWAVFALGLAGSAMAHPNTIFAVLALGTPLVVAAVRSTAATATRRRERVVPLVLLAGYALIALALWVSARPTAAHWRPFESLPQAFGEAAFLAPIGRETPFVLAALLVVGVWSELRRRRLWVIGGHLVAVLLFVVVAGVWNDTLRTFIVGVWYNDASRVAALLAVFGIPLAALGAAAVHRRMLGLLERTSAGRRRWIRVAAAAALFGVLVAGSQWRTLSAQVPFLRDQAYAFDEDSPIVSPDEAAVFDEIEEIVPEGEMVAGNPWSGAALVYAYTGHPALLPHLQGAYGEERWEIARSLVDDVSDVCDELSRLGISHVLDFGDRYVISGRGDADHYAGLNDLDESDDLRLVAEHGDARLYEITACR